MAAASSGVAPDAAAGGEDLFGPLDRALLVEIRCHQPLVQVERVAGGGEDGAAVDDAERAVHAQAKPFEHGGEVPGIDRLAVDRGLAADGVEPGAVQEGRQQRMAGERLVEPGEAAAACARAPASAGSRFFSRCRPQQCVEHFFHPRRTGRRRAASRRRAVLRHRSALNQRLARQATQTGRFGAIALLSAPTPLPALRMPDKSPCRA